MLLYFHGGDALWAYLIWIGVMPFLLISLVVYFLIRHSRLYEEPKNNEMNIDNPTSSKAEEIE
jgi:phosphotransferase system  glucose/maltose/N-acetylglucosamine-specific IIC component